MATYKIKPGDTLYGIAKSLAAQGINTNVSELAKLNNLADPNMIRAGATLNLPGSAPAAAPAQARMETALTCGLSTTSHRRAWRTTLPRSRRI